MWEQSMPNGHVGFVAVRDRSAPRWRGRPLGGGVAQPVALNPFLLDSPTVTSGAFRVQVTRAEIGAETSPKKVSPDVLFAALTYARPRRGRGHTERRRS